MELQSSPTASLLGFTPLLQCEAHITPQICHIYVSGRSLNHAANVSHGCVVGTKNHETSTSE